MGEVVDESAWWVPGAGLRPFVSWGCGFRQAGMAPGRHRGVPAPALTFIVTLDDPLVVAEHADPRQPGGTYESLIGGLHTAPALITHPGRWSGIQLAVTPLGARALFGLPAGELANLDVDAAQVTGGFAAELQDRVRSQPSWARRFAVVDEALGRRAAGFALGRGGGRSRGGRSDGVRPEVAHAWRRLRDSNGAVPVAALAAETGWSARHLGARFRAEVGLSPKAAARVFRFDAARRRLARAATNPAAANPAAASPAAARQPGVRLADLAADCGYYDQAHLAAEFRALAGCSPSRWLAEEFRFFQATPVPWRNDGGMTQAPPPQVWPSLGARDARAMIRFLVDAFGFTETIVHGEGDRVDHAELAWPLGGGVMLGSAATAKGADAPGSFHAYVVCDEPDALFARAVENGAEVTSGLSDTDYGSRDFAVRDPEGNHWSFGTYRGHPR